MQRFVLRILDASLNRAAEGLRVVEDYARFVLDDPYLTSTAKVLRHDLATAAAAISSVDRHTMRDTQGDVGTAISTHEETQRRDAADVCAASLKRTEQALRSLEEYGKLASSDFSGRCESLRYRLYTLEKALDVGCWSQERLSGVQLCVLIDGRDTLAGFEHLIRELIGAGVHMLQLRDKTLDDRQLVERARLLVSLTRHQPAAPPEVGANDRCSAETTPTEPGAATLGRRTLAIINDRADIAATVDADGVHVGQDDLSVQDARAIIGPRKLIGVSTHAIEQARAAVLEGANYLGAGPTFPSTTKSFETFAGSEYLRQVAREIRLPTFAIGGITTTNVPDVLAAGITRIAVSSAVAMAVDPASVVRHMSTMLKSSGSPPMEASNASGS